MTERPSPRVPLGIPISRRIQLPAGRSFDPVRRALNAIDSVHGDGVLPSLPVIRTRGRVQVGAYEWNEYTGEALRLSFSSMGTHPELSVAHEIGHFLDHQALGRPGRFASETDGCQDLMAVIGQSAAIRALVHLRGRRIVLVPVGSRREAEPVNQRLVNYLLMPREQFARAYAQYITLASQAPVLSMSVEATRRTSLSAVYHPQWDDGDFEPIRRQFDGLFRRMRWMTP